MDNNGGWKNWGDHPIVVIVACVASILSIVAFFKTPKDSASAPDAGAPKASSPDTSSPEPLPLIPVESDLLDNIDLESARSVDYSRLKMLLAAREWEEADKETLMVMLKAAHRVKEDRFDRVSLLNFPCEDLKVIDNLSK